jgi:multidrug efflux system membrane fusion protein
MSQQTALTRDEQKRRGWWLWAATVVMLLVFYRTMARLGGAREESIEAFAGIRSRSVPVATVAAKTGDLKIYVDEQGTVTPLNKVIVRARVDGELVDVYFKEGQTIKAGDLLAMIDPRPYQVQLTQAEAQMARDRALLVNAQGQLARYKELFAQNIISRQELDTQQSRTGQYAAAVRNDQALIDRAKLSLIYCRITSPINGRVESRLIDPGNIVRAFEPQGLMVITQIQPVEVNFNVPEYDEPGVMKAILNMSQLPVDAYAPGFNNRIATGTVLTQENEIDQTTRTLKLRASFRNEDSALLPNQSVNTRLLVDTMHDAVLIPAPAVQRNGQGDFVYVVNPDQTVALRSVDVGATQGGTSAISRGLNPGELVVVDSTDKLHRGSRVKVQPDDSTNLSSHPASGHSS